MFHRPTPPPTRAALQMLSLSAGVAFAPRPHLVTILADDLGWHDTNSTRPRPTPTITTSAPACSLSATPSGSARRPAALLSGRSPLAITTVQPDGNHTCSDFLPRKNDDDRREADVGRLRVPLYRQGPPRLRDHRPSTGQSRLQVARRLPPRCREVRARLPRRLRRVQRRPVDGRARLLGERRAGNVGGAARRVQRRLLRRQGGLTDRGAPEGVACFLLRAPERPRAVRAAARSAGSRLSVDGRQVYVYATCSRCSTTRWPT